MNFCTYCSEKVEEKCDSYLMCSKCGKYIHSNCLKSSSIPGGLVGDVFFDFDCEECSSSNKEEISRQKLSWMNLIVLALYNLHKQSEGVSQRGYFHWNVHICRFIEKHWSILCGSDVKMKKNWMGTISGTLSHFSPTYFRSGTEELREAGWWRLTHSLTPRQIMELYSKSQLEKRKLGSTRSSNGTALHSSAPSSPARNSPSPSLTSSRDLRIALDDSSSSAFEETSNIELNNVESEQEMETPCSSGHASASGSFAGWNTMKVPDNMYSRAYMEPSETLSGCLFADDDDEDNCTDMDIDIEEEEGSFNFSYASTQSFQDLHDFLHPGSITGQTDPLAEDLNADDDQSSSYGMQEKEIKTEEVEAGSDDHFSEGGDELSGPVEPVAKSLFFVRSNQKKPWETLENEDPKESFEARCMPMSEYEELRLLNQLRRAPNINSISGPVRRLYRKLCVRRMKCQRNMPLFNLDNVLDKSPGVNRSVWSNHTRNARGYGMDDVRILDRFQHAGVLPEGMLEPHTTSFMYRLMGVSEPTCFYSPYTHRLLKPFIRRDYESTPLWLKLLQEIQARANKNVPGWTPPTRCPIDYSYVRPEHIATINSLCSEFFYPGIDVTECLQYPDFSCVVLYRKMIIGFAFMVPDVGYNETYISFLFTRQEWRRAGIGSFMLYHLIQTCMGKDVTLHVSATNPALILYQKFGFKVEEFVQDFYEKYFPADSAECKHALFLRLHR